MHFKLLKANQIDRKQHIKGVPPLIIALTRSLFADLRIVRSVIVWYLSYLPISVANNNPIIVRVIKC